jgi:hypothetical protein
VAGQGCCVRHAAESKSCLSLADYHQLLLLPCLLHHHHASLGKNQPARGSAHVTGSRRRPELREEDLLPAPPPPIPSHSQSGQQQAAVRTASLACHAGNIEVAAAAAPASAGPAAILAIALPTPSAPLAPPPASPPPALAALLPSA